MKSMFINGLLRQDLDASAVQMAMWNNLTIWKVSIKKVSSFFSKQDEINKMIEEERKKYVYDSSGPFVPADSQKDPEELDAKLLKSLCDHLSISTRGITSIGDLDELGAEIEKKTIMLQKEITKNDFKGKTIHELIKYNMEKMFENLKEDFEKKSDEEKKKIVKNVLDIIQEMPDEQKEILRKELEVDSIGQGTVLKAISAGSLGVAFAAVVEIAGFSAYTFATATLAEIVGIVGIGLPFAAYGSLTTVIAFMANPLFIIPGALILGIFMTKRANKKIRNSLLPILVTQISIASTQNSEPDMKSDQIIDYLEKLNIDEVEEGQNEGENETDNNIDDIEATTFLNLGIEKINESDYIRSLQDFNKSLEHNPNHYEAYYQRGFAKAQLGDHRGAVQDFDKSIQVNPNFSEAYYQRGLSKIQLNQKDEGCLDLSKAGELGFSQAYEAINENCN